MCSLYSLSLIGLLCLCSSLAIADDVLRRQRRQQSPNDVEVIESTSSKEGFIISPNFQKEETRVYKFQGRPDERVQIIFNKFDLYKLLPNEKCGWRNSFVSFERDLDDPVYLCSPSLPLLSEKSEFILKYEVPRNFPAKEEFTGFNASYKFITNFGVNSTGKQNRTDQCHFNFDSKDAKSGSFNSPNFPGLYPRNTDCTYTFHSTNEKNLTIEFTKFSLLGSNKNCSSALVDVLELTETSKNYKSFFDEKRCGKQDVPFSIKVNASSFTVTLIRSMKKLNDSVFNEPRAFIGFQANYTFTNAGLSNLSSGSSLYLLVTVLCLISSSCFGLRFI